MKNKSLNLITLTVLTLFILLACTKTQSDSSNYNSLNPTETSAGSSKNSTNKKTVFEKKTLRAVAVNNCVIVSFANNNGYYKQSCPVHGVYNDSKHGFGGSKPGAYNSGFVCSKCQKRYDVKIEFTY